MCPPVRQQVRSGSLPAFPHPHRETPRLGALQQITPSGRQQDSEREVIHTIFIKIWCVAVTSYVKASGQHRGQGTAPLLLSCSSWVHADMLDVSVLRRLFCCTQKEAASSGENGGNKTQWLLVATSRYLSRAQDITRDCFSILFCNPVLEQDSGSIFNTKAKSSRMDFGKRSQLRPLYMTTFLF